MVLRKSFYIRWSAGRSPRVHEVNPGRDPSLSLLILGPRQPGNNMDVYLAPLIEDLKLLWEVGI